MQCEYRESRLTLPAAHNSATADKEAEIKPQIARYLTFHRSQSEKTCSTVTYGTPCVCYAQVHLIRKIKHRKKKEKPTLRFPKHVHRAGEAARQKLFETAFAFLSLFSFSFSPFTLYPSFSCQGASRGQRTLALP